jgi:hypothetical protein
MLQLPWFETFLVMNLYFLTQKFGAPSSNLVLHQVILLTLSMSEINILIGRNVSRMYVGRA